MSEVIGLSPVGIGDLSLRLYCALVSSLVIGLERETKEKAANKLGATCLRFLP